MAWGKMLDGSRNKGTLRLYLRNINVRWGAFELSDVLKMRFEDDEVERYSIDLIIYEGGEFGRCAVWQSEVLYCRENIGKMQEKQYKP